MNRLLALLTVTISLAACTTTVTQNASTSTTAPCRTADATISGVLWMQTSAEYQAITREVYSTARRTLDVALADPNWSAVSEVPSPDATLPPAVILDLDETMLDTSAFQASLIQNGKSYSEERWHEFALQDASRPILAALDFVKYARQRGVAIFYVTNRYHSEEASLRTTLDKYGFPFDPSVDTLLTRSKRSEWESSNKSSRRAFVASRYRVVALFGDDLNDFLPANGKTLQERADMLQKYDDFWGKKWFMIPNPVYGSWDRSLIPDTKGLNDCEQLQKKIDMIKGR